MTISYAVDNGIPCADGAVQRGKNKDCSAGLATLGDAEVGWVRANVSDYSSRSAEGSCGGSRVQRGCLQIGELACLPRHRELRIR